MTVELRHPSWCAPDRCDVFPGNPYGVHRGVPHVVSRDPETTTTVVAALWLSAGDDAPRHAAPLIEVRFRTDYLPDASAFDLSVAQARQLRRVLGDLIETATRRHP